MAWAIMAVGLRGLIVNRGVVMPTNPPGWAALALGANVVHDAVLGLRRRRQA